MSTPVPGVLSRRSHRRCARIRCAPPVARNATHSSHGAQEAHLHAEHDAPDHGHGRDQAVPGPADSLEGRQGGRSGQALPAAHLRQIVKVHNNWKYLCLRPTEEAIIARYMLKHGNISAPSAAPPSTSPDPSSSDAAASAAPSSGSAGPSTSGHAADPPSADPLGGVDMSLLQRAGVLQNTPYDA